MKFGDSFDILYCRNWKTKPPKMFPEREWVRGGDTRIWVDGEISHHADRVEDTLKWLKKNYDAVYFGFAYPHPTKAYPTPEFLPMYDVELPKIAGVTDGYFEDYKEWSECLNKVNRIFVVQPTYADIVRKAGFKHVQVSLAPFNPKPIIQQRSVKPLVVWPNQWKNIKGCNEFLDQVPAISKSAIIELYSCGIRYYQLRTEPRWLNAVGEDKFMGFNGHGSATYFGNVDVDVITKAYQRAWFTCNLQGMRSKKPAYQKGSYNLTEVESLYYGCCPILHESTLQTGLPHGSYLTTSDGSDIAKLIKASILSKFALDPVRQKLAKDYVLGNHLATDKYLELRKWLV